MLSGKLPTQSSSKPSDEPPWPLGAVPSGKLPRPSSAEPISKLPRPSRPTSGMLCRSHRMLSGEASRARQQALRGRRARYRVESSTIAINASRPASCRGRQALSKEAIEHHAERQAAKAFELQASGEPSWPMSAVPSDKLPKPSIAAPGRP
jgi:hypothetical protein